MTEIQQEQTAEHEKGNPPKYKNKTVNISRSERRHPPKKKYRNDRTPVNSGFLQMGTSWDGKAIYKPKRKKLKGWQRKN